MSYSDKLKDPRWQKKRLKIMERDNWECCVCGEKKDTLNVHHNKYSGNPWDVEDIELITLCESCHKNTHDLEKIIGPYLCALSKHKGIQLLYLYRLLVNIWNMDNPEKITPNNVDMIIYCLDNDSYNDTIKKEYDKLKGGKNV